MVPFKVVILGSNSAIPTLKRNTTSHLLIYNEQYFLIDCGESTQLQLRKFRYKFQRINHIFISHLHGDHYFGLIGLINSMHLMGRKLPLHLYGHLPLKKIINLQLEASDTRLQYPLIFHPINPKSTEIILDHSNLTVSTFPLDHRIPANGFMFREKPVSPKMKKDFIETLGLSAADIVAIKEGGNYQTPDGKSYSHETLTFPAPMPRSYAFCSDTGYNEHIIPHIKHASLLYHESTFLHEMVNAAREKFHSTSLDAATIAKKAQVSKLLIGHFSSRYKDISPLLAEARKIFPATHAVEDGEIFPIK